MGASSPLASLACRLFLPPKLRRHVTGARAGRCGVGATAARRGASVHRVAASVVSPDADPRGRSEGGGGVYECIPAGASDDDGSSGANWGVFVSGARGKSRGGRCVGAQSAMQRGRCEGRELRRGSAGIWSECCVR